jgi:hypothetical protein
VSRSRSDSNAAKSTTIGALRRVFFDVDFNLVGREYSIRARTNRAIKHSRISWIYLHSIELDKAKVKYWLCKHCYDGGICKVLVASSTGGISRHINTHGAFAPGTTPPNGSNTMDSFVGGVHPLAAERWRENFVNWITYDNISFEQAASPWLRKVILNGGQHVQHLLPYARTVRSWLIETYTDRITEVKTSLTHSRSRIVLSFDAWSSPNHCSMLGVVAH